MSEPPTEPTREAAKPESVLDRKVHLQERLILEIPEVAPLCEQFEGTRGRVQIGDCELHCEQEGDGVPIVLLHGGPGATHHGFHPHFSLAKGFAKVIYYDQRGCGISDDERGEGYSIEQAVDDLDALRKALELERWVVLGHSYGGLLAQSYAVKYPESLAGLILVGSSLAMPVPLEPTRQYDFLSGEERRKIASIHRNRELSMAVRVYNAFLNGDWKRQSFYRPSREKIAHAALHEWKHDPEFRSRVGNQTQNVDLGGAFKGCPIPTLILEGEWDLTWNTDKPKVLRKNHPNSKLVMFERSSHSPFEDESERFFQILKEFVGNLGEIAADALARWKEHLIAWQREKEKSPAHVLRKHGYGRKSNEKIAESYREEWLKEIDAADLLLKAGFALYDLERYAEALSVFTKMVEAAGEGPSWRAVSLVWQGHMLDLMDRRKDAIAAYQQAAALNVSGNFSHSQFGMTYSPSKYAAERVKKPFVRLENRQDD